MKFENMQELADHLNVDLESESFDEEIAEKYNVLREDIEGVPFEIINNEIHIKQ